MSKARVRNPVNGTEVFATIPALRLVQRKKGGIFNTSPAPVYLLEGKHTGPNKGFGVVHIWAEHSDDVKAAGFASIVDVPAYVSRIFQSPCNIYFEDRDIPVYRVNTVRIVTGTAILEYFRPQYGGVEVPYWSVVTAYSNTRTAGVLVEAI